MALQLRQVEPGLVHRSFQYDEAHKSYRGVWLRRDPHNSRDAKTQCERLIWTNSASNPRLHVELFDETGGQVDVDRQTIWDDVGDVATYWGEAPSLQRQAALETLKLIASRGCWSEQASSDVDDHPGWRHGRYQRPAIEVVGDVFRYFSFCDPWAILDDAASNIIGYDTRHPLNFYSQFDSREEHERWTREQQHSDRMTREGWNLILDRRHKSYLSAASVAINFLEGIPAGRRNIRNIVLKEAHVGMGHTECHGLGLIKFCKENPELRVERRANLWKSILLTCIGEGIGDDEIYEDGITQRVALWVVEALALVPAGMPAGSFTLVLDGDPAPAQSAQLFQRVQRDAAWQTALSESFNRGLLPDMTYVDKRSRGGYMYEDFPQAMREISKGTCRAVRANFDVGEPWDAEAMIEAHRGCKLEDWHDKWFLDTHFQTAPPLPEWRVVRKESGRLTRLPIFDAP